MRNPALRILGFGAAAFMFVTVLGIGASGEAKRQALAKQQAVQKVQQAQQQMRARAAASTQPRSVADDDWRARREYESVRAPAESRDDADYRDVASQRDSYYEPPRVVVETEARYDRYESRERTTEQRRTDAEADRLTRQLDSRLYER